MTYKVNKMSGISLTSFNSRDLISHSNELSEINFHFVFFFLITVMFESFLNV